MIRNLSAIIAFLFVAVVSQPAVASDTTSAIFRSQGSPIHVDVATAAGAGVHPAVILLYGADGMGFLPWEYPGIATWFASQGYNCYVVHYFDKTGTILATPLVSFNGFGLWLQAINDATTWVLSQPSVDPHRIGLMGLSLGASLGVSEASRDLRIKALASWSGAEATWYEHNVHNTITHLPPTIILHGGQDQISPLDNAYALQTLLQNMGTPSELEIYPNENHAFSPSDQMHALQQILAFFQTYFAK